MTLSRLRVLAVVPLLSAMGCGALLGISPSDSQGKEESERAGGSGSGSGGEAAQAGAPVSSGATSGHAGDAGSPSSGGTGGPDAGGDMGVGGDVGEGGADTSDFPQPGQACATSGALACYFPNPESPEPTRARLRCERGTWVPTASCPDDNPRPTRCDRRDGMCQERLCAENERPGEPRLTSCYSSSFKVCGPDLVTIEDRPCVFGCTMSNACRVASTTELVIDRPRGVANVENPWPERVIPVCWRDLHVDDAATTRARAAVRIAVESLWSRVSSVSFAGWGSCDSSQARVELAFAEDCQGELARLPRDGYPGGEAALPVTLCKSYYDFTPALQPTIELDLLGLVAQHAFGHVLGIEDVLHDENPGVFMDPVLELSSFRERRPEAAVLDSLAAWYGSAPGPSLVSPDGRCLAYESGILSASACDGSSAQAWELRESSLAQGSGKCVLGPETGDAVTIADCSSEPLETEKWLPARVRIQWRDLCLVAADEVPATSSLTSGDCADSWPAEQRFRLELVGPARVRIHTNTAGHRCVVAPETWTQPSLPGFGPCDGVRDVFDAEAGTLGQAGRCLTRDALGAIVFEPCGAAPNQRFRLSGALEQSGGALTFPIGEESVQLTWTLLGAKPAANQIFDYRF